MCERETAERSAPEGCRDARRPDAIAGTAPLSATPTIADVARNAGVSRSTVSRVLNGSSALSDQARRAVLDSAASLNYVPDEHARQLARRNTKVSRATG